MVDGYKPRAKMSSWARPTLTRNNTSVIGILSPPDEIQPLAGTSTRWSSSSSFETRRSSVPALSKRTARHPNSLQRRASASEHRPRTEHDMLSAELRQQLNITSTVTEVDLYRNDTPYNLQALNSISSDMFLQGFALGARQQALMNPTSQPSVQRTQSAQQISHDFKSCDLNLSWNKPHQTSSADIFGNEAISCVPPFDIQSQATSSDFSRSMSIFNQLTPDPLMATMQYPIPISTPNFSNPMDEFELIFSNPCFPVNLDVAAVDFSFGSNQGLRNTDHSQTPPHFS